MNYFRAKNKFGDFKKEDVDDFDFNQQYQTFLRRDFAKDSTIDEVNEKLEGNGTRKRKGKDSERSSKKKYLESVDIGNDPDDPWAPIESTISDERKVEFGEKNEKEAKHPENEDSQQAEQSNVHILEPDEEDEMWEKVNERKMSHLLPPRPSRGSQMSEAKSTFHGDSQVDYQGRSWTAVPAGLKPDDGHDCYIPKKCVKKLTGHTKGVQQLEFVPGTGHLLLSASMDGKCKIWDSNSTFDVKRTYIGHTEAVRSIHFSNTGANFLSSGFDRNIRWWDVETGTAISSFSNRKMAYTVQLNPKENHQFLAACSDNRIYQWDTRTGEVVQEYNYHLQSCNTVLFVDEGRKFISTSDDKKILVWEYGIPVPIKYLAEPDMFCVPSVSMHPSNAFFAGQSMDNKIVVYACGEKVKPLKKKVFRGHNNSGYACQIGFSPNGKFLMSGDGLGQLHFWDWKSTKTYRKFHAHDSGPCMSAQWHPLHPNRVATCGWDGLIKIWE